MDNQISDFGKIRSVIWPIHNFELKKFIPMSFLMFTILFVYTSVNNLKDVFIQKYANLGGAELVAPLKGIFVLPTALLAAVVFSSLISKFGMSKTFYIISTFFAFFFLIFAFILFPNASKIHMSTETMIKMRESSPGFLYYVIPCIGNWSYSLFFILAETWGAIMNGSMFWYLANQITKESEVSRFYALYTLIGSVGRLISGRYIEQMSKVNDVVQFDKNVKVLVCSASSACILTMALYFYISKIVLSDRRLYDPLQVRPKKNKAKVKFFDGIKILMSSKYLFLMLMLSICCGIGINLLEGVFKGHIKEMSNNPSDTGKIMGQISQKTAISNILLTFVSAYVLRKFKWKYAALVTPMILISLGSVFFMLMSYLKFGKTEIIGLSLADLALWLGISVDSFVKGIKYSLFDTTKGIAYRPLGAEEQAQGQGAIEIVGGRFGKGIGAMITMLFTSVVFPGSKILDHTYSFFVMFIITLAVWIVVCNKLGNLYEEKVAENKKQ